VRWLRRFGTAVLRLQHTQLRRWPFLSQQRLFILWQPG
jgi:hypothetical protein